MARRESGRLYAGRGKGEETHTGALCSADIVGAIPFLPSRSSPIFPPRHQVSIAREREGQSGVHLMLDTEPDLKTDENKARGPQGFYSSRVKDQH